jgi:hypothetical protein
MYTYSSVAGMSQYGKKGEDIVVHDAFPSFFSARDVEVVDDILTGCRRPWMEGTYRGPRNHPLPLVRCSLRRDGRVCGHKMGIFYNAAGKYEYVCGSCAIFSRNTAKVHPHIDHLVLDIVESVFRPEAIEYMARHIDQGSIDVDAAIADLQKRLRSAEDRLDGAMEIQAEARGAGDHDLAGVWARKVARCREDIAASTKKHLELERERERLATLDARGASAVAALAADFGGLLRAAKLAEQLGQATGVVRKLLAAVTKAVHVRTLMPTLYEVQVEFPSGDRIGGYVTTARVVSSTHEYLFLQDQLARGASPASIAEQLSAGRAAFPSYTTAKSRRGPWSPEAVMGVALAFPDRKPPRARRNAVPISSLAACTEVPLHRVMGAAMAEALGPAVTRNGEICCAPTESELAKAFPEFSIRSAALAAGWPPDDVVTVADLVVEVGAPSRTGIEALANRLGARVLTTTGIAVARRSVVVAHLGYTPVPAGNEIPAEHSHLDVHGWRTREQLRREYPAAAVPALCAGSPSFMRENRAVFYHVSPALAQQVLEGDMRTVLADLGYGHLEPAEFMHGHEVIRFLKSRYGVGNPGSLGNAVRKGRVLKVRANRPGMHGAYYWVPEEVRTGSDPAVVSEWMSGRYPPPDRCTPVHDLPEGK